MAASAAAADDEGAAADEARLRARLHAADTVVEVDAGALRGNARAFAGAARARGHALMAVVKANGYGHGAEAAARAALEGGAEWLGVARSCEAAELREAGVDAPLLVLGLTPPGDVPRMLRLGVSMAVVSAAGAAGVAAAAAAAGAAAAGWPAPRVHLKLDTGMHRLGAPASEAAAVSAACEEALGVPLEGVFSHFPVADSDAAGDVAKHGAMVARFEEAVASMARVPPVRHAGNSATCQTGLMPRCVTLERVGISYYGLAPAPGWPAGRMPRGVRPALRWVARLTMVKRVPAGGGVSYGHHYVAPEGGARVGTVSAGYHDGVRRCDGNRVAVRGRLVPVLGRVCMDQMMVLLDDVPDAEAGDPVELIGPLRPVADVAAAWGTIDYEVVCSIDALRVPRAVLDVDASVLA